MSTKLKICTFNLRCPSQKDGINYFDNRKDLILACIEREKPDVIGFQEAADSSRAWLLDVLNDYVMFGCGRKADLSSEANFIAFKKHDFQALSMENFWLSLAPSVPGSTFGADQSKCARLATTVVLKHKDAEKPFLFINTHLDHKGSAARIYGSIPILQYIDSKKLPFVLTGDLNAYPDDPEIKVLTDCAYLNVTDLTAELEGTFHDYGRRVPNSKIDYILTDMPGDPAEAYMVKDVTPEGVYISDHYPVFAYVDAE
jgi:endonuclease/exonuclease/phosphatase family metal-dependent hydrolase